MTYRDVIARVEAIEDVAHDYEKAHGMEDALWEDVLREIANAHPDSFGLARYALKTKDIEFARYCA